MRLRTLTIWRKFKPVWLGIAGWAVISIVMMVLWGYSIMDFRGGLPNVEVASCQTIEIDKKHPVKTIDIRAEGVAVELGSSYDIKEIQIQLYGKDYINQKASWVLSEAGELQIRMDTYPVIANAYGYRAEDGLTMRILLPTKSYDAITIQGKRLNTALYQCKAKQLTVNTAYGSIALNNTDFQRAALSSETAGIHVERSRIHHLEIHNDSGDTVLFDNQLRYIRYFGDSGSLNALTDKIKGIWELSSDEGNIYIGTRKWHNNLLLQLSSDEGTVKAFSKTKPWKETISEALTEHELILLEGRGEHMLCADSQSGNITLDTVKFAR
ncbi:MAG: DUF4097 family beta strand repeat protein [Peptococcaceae bacterium]|nr:DUF4097 family beta strand repeat protein [Peptococcaceae bacterium]MBQ3206254.1 DUF4097 family beta strand repeat protein [Peptococcaceae bacterium]MBQ6853750.1 DUF4097 family beta strand repeat protein [Peptococcaceae bacterium]MBQ7026167.1 DUF4097 family beta strand repeat protein [Peptococcaceae bacterium]